MLEEMIRQAEKIKGLAYAPYSKFKVGVCIRTPDNQLYVGCNVENASYSLTLCAEASAIAAMIGDGHNKIEEVVVIGDTKNPLYPCGACRQRLWEFATPDTSIHCCNSHGELHTVLLGDLMPHAFGPNDLNITT